MAVRFQVALSHTRDPAEIPFGELLGPCGAEGSSSLQGQSLRPWALWPTPIKQMSTSGSGARGAEKPQVLLPHSVMLSDPPKMFLQTKSSAWSV